MAFKHILVPIDGSGHAWKAAELAMDMIKQGGGKLTLLHVTRKFKVPEKLRQYLDEEHLRGEPLYAIDDATEKVIAEIKRDAEKRGVKRVRTLFKEGHPSRTIAKVAKDEKADVIVMGSRGLTDIEGALLGSVSHKVASLAHCTVVLVR